METQRSLSELLTELFQDGQTNAISAARLRDMIVSLQGAYGGIYATTPAETTISEAGTYVKAAGDTSYTSAAQNLVDNGGTSNRLRYTGTKTRQFIVTCNTSVTFASGTNQIAGIRLWKYDASAESGAYVTGAEARTTVAGSGIAQITVVGDVSLDEGDYLEVHVANHTNTNNITLDMNYLYMEGWIT